MPFDVTALRTTRLACRPPRLAAGLAPRVNSTPEDENDDEDDSPFSPFNRKSTPPPAIQSEIVNRKLNDLGRSTSCPFNPSFGRLRIQGHSAFHTGVFRTGPPAQKSDDAGGGEPSVV